MKIFGPLFLFLFITGCARVEPPKVETTEAVESVVGNILMEAQAIKPGMTRADLSTYFMHDGGIYGGPKSARYDSKRCDMIKIDVKFNLTNSDQRDELPTDTVVSVSRPYLEYPISD
jgi:hypothetical protein